MSNHNVDVQIEEPYKSHVEQKPLQRVAKAVLQQQRVEEPCELAVVVSGDETLHQLNRRHRGVDAPTDVLAFPHETKSPGFTFIDAPGFPRYLGDVIISFPRAKAQAVEAENELLAELQLLVIHGVLHLLGYDDETEPERTRMWQAQQAVLDDMDIQVHLLD